MTLLQKQKYVVRRLIELADQHGRGYFSLSVIGAEIGHTADELFDKETETGIRWPIAQWGTGYVQVLPGHFDCACIDACQERWLESWASHDESEVV